MAKKTVNLNYSNASLTTEDGQYILTETTKDDTKVFNLTSVLDSIIGLEGVSITIKTVEEIISEE